jgi:hypothetical protein
MIQLLNGNSKINAYKNLQNSIPDFLNSLYIDQLEIGFLDGLLNFNISELPEEKIESSGYVIHTLEASIWCFLKTESYQEAVIKAIDLGNDTDTTGCVTGGIAGLYYGFKNIPEKWRKNILKYEEIDDLSERLYYKIKEMDLNELQRLQE